MSLLSALVIAGLATACAWLAWRLRQVRRATAVGLREVFEAMREPALVLAPDGAVLEANPAAVQLLGEDDAERVRGGSLLALAPQLETARRAAQRSAEPRRLAGDLDGFSADISHINDARGRRSASVVIVHDERTGRERERGLVSAAHTDPLTGAANRAGFESAFADALALRGDHGAVGLLYLDLDGFKPINDEHGHAVGDAVLQRVAERLQRALRDGDVVGRLGGDEFALLLRSVTPAGLAAVTGRVRSVFEASIVINELDLTVGASVGLASAPRDGVSVQALIAAADERMYRDKRAKQQRAASVADDGGVADQGPTGAVDPPPP